MANSKLSSPPALMMKYSEGCLNMAFFTCKLKVSAPPVPRDTVMQLPSGAPVRRARRSTLLKTSNSSSSIEGPITNVMSAWLKNFPEIRSRLSIPYLITRSNPSSGRRTGGGATKKRRKRQTRCPATPARALREQRAGIPGASPGRRHAGISLRASYAYARFLSGNAYADGCFLV